MILQVFINILMVLLSLNHFPTVNASKYNVSLVEMSTCKEYDIRSTAGYKYQDFFHLNTMQNHKIADNERLHLKFYVLTTKDAHVMLSATNLPRPKDRVYEVVIGAGGNTFAGIRAQMGTMRVSTNQDHNILSPYDPTPIEIIQTKDGNISVYIPGYKREPLLTYLDRAPIQVNYISFSTFGTASAKWFYDCKFDGFENEFEEEIHPLSPLQQLLANITVKGENRSMPLDMKAVNFSFEIRSVAYQQEKSILNTRLSLILRWQDTRLAWDPKDFDGIDAIYQKNLAIWVPQLIVLNGAFDTKGHFTPDFDLIVFANGSITFMANNAEFKTWCFDGQQNWPHERLKCGLIMGLVNFEMIQHAPLQLAYDYAQPLPNEAINTLSEWQFQEVMLTTIANDDDDDQMSRYNKRGITQTMSGDVSLEFVIKRNGFFYKNVFTMPILACETFIMLSFLLRGYRRGALLLLVFVIISMGLMFATKHAPHAYIPNTLHAYRHVMSVSTLCYLLHVTIIWLEMYPPKAKPYGWLMTIINSSPLRLVLCMRFADGTKYVEIQSNPWPELAKMINNVCFVAMAIYLGVINILLLPNF